MGMFLRRGPDTRRKVHDLAPGTVIKLPSSGGNVDFFISKHNYEEAMNGPGRTLVVRRYLNTPPDGMTFGSSRNYKTSNIDTWFNGYYLNLFGAEMKAKIGTTTFYCYDVDSSAVTTLTRSVFTPSMAELGFSETYAPVEGSVLPNAADLLIAAAHGANRVHWTRTCSKNGSKYVYAITASGAATTYRYSTSQYLQPCFTIPGNMVITDDMLA